MSAATSHEYCNEKQAAKEFLSALLELTYNSKYVINSLSNLAKIHIQCAQTIAETVKQHILRVPSDWKLPLMYLVDCMAKTYKTYRKLFEPEIVSIFCDVFNKVDENTRQSLYSLRQTWNDIFPSKVLHELDEHVRELDENWPVLTKPALRLTCSASQEDAKILVSSGLKSSEHPLSSASKRKCSSKELRAKQTRFTYNTDKRHIQLPNKVSINVMAAACLGVHPFITILYAVEEMSTSRGTRSPFLKERKEKGRFHTAFEDLLKCEVKFKENFHMDRETFFCLYEKVENILEPKKNTHPNDQITPKEKLAVVLEFFACGTLQRHIASVYRISKQHFGKIIDEVCNAICLALTAEIPAMSAEQMRKTASTFAKWNFPNCIGAIDGKHVAIKCPPKSGSIFYNYKGFFSIVLMAVVNGDYEFTYVDIGAYGTEGDANVFKNCSLGKAIAQNMLQFPIHGTQSTPYVFVADDAFPLHHRIMKPYKPTKSTPLDEGEQIFNYRLSRSRRCVENAFGILCSKNYCLSTTMFCGPDRAKNIIKACVYLHNFLIRTRREKYCPPNYADRETRTGEIIDGIFRKELPRDSLFHSNFNSTYKGRVHDSGKLVRENIKNYFNSEEGSVSWQRKVAFLE